jgi:hypothetical protein
MARISPDRAYRISATFAVAAALIVGAATWDTTTAQISASTGNESNSWDAGNVDIESDATSRLLFDADNLFPGRIVENCVAITYVGSVDAVDVRVFGSVAGGTGLDAHLETRVLAGDGGGHDDCTGFVASGSPLFTGTFAELAGDHGSFEAGLPLMTAVDEGASRTLQVTVEVADTDAAQSLVTEFELVIEARP